MLAMPQLLPGDFLVPLRGINMIILFRCGHEGTAGFWKDDAWMKSPKLCAQCQAKNRNRLQPGYRLLVIGSKSFVIKLARVAQR